MEVKKIFVKEIIIVVKEYLLNEFYVFILLGLLRRSKEVVIVKIDMIC